MSKKIKLKDGVYAIVDESDYEELSKHKWTLKGDGYAHRGTPRPERKWILMHRQIMQPLTSMQVDHINGNRLDNRRCNLRICTLAENRMNTPKQSRNTSGYKGVSLHKQSGLWVAKIRHDTVGYYKTKLEAAIRYNELAPSYFGEYAKLNIIEETV